LGFFFLSVCFFKIVLFIYIPNAVALTAPFPRVLYTIPLPFATEWVPPPHTHTDTHTHLTLSHLASPFPGASSLYRHILAH